MTGNNDITSFEFINTFSQNNNDFVLKMVDLFLVQCPEMLFNLEEAILNEKWAETTKLAHTFITSLKFMGMNEAAQKLKLIEYNAKNGVDLADMETLFFSIKVTCVQAIEELEKKKSILENV